MKHRLLSLFLVLCMVFPLVPSNAAEVDSGISIDAMLNLSGVTGIVDCTTESLAGNGHFHSDDSPCWTWYTEGVNLNGNAYTGNVLVLDGVDIVCSTHSTGIYLPDNTTIVTVAGSVNTVTAASNDGGNSYGIYGAGNLTFDGGGTLTVTGGAATGGASYGIYAVGSVRIDGGIVNATGTTTSGPDGGDTCTVSFDSQGGQAIPSVTVAPGGTLTELPVPGRSGSVFTGWYQGDTPVGTDTEFHADATLVAKYETLSGNELQYTDTTFTQSEAEADLSFTINASGKSDEQVKAALSLAVLDNSGDITLAVAGSGNTFTVSAEGGFTPGGAYRLTLGDGLSFVGKDELVRNCEFTIKRSEVFEIEFNENLSYLEMDKLTNITQNGVSVQELNSSLYQLTTDGGGQITKDTGTFRLSSGTLGVGDVVCLHSGNKPVAGDDQGFINDNIAYVKITDVKDGVYTYVSAEPEEVLLMPDVLPVSNTADTDGNPDNQLITVSKDTFDYSNSIYAEAGLNAATTVDKGDFLSFYSGTYGAGATMTGYGRVTSVNLVGSFYIVAYDDATVQDIENAVNYYSQHDIDPNKLIENVDISALERDIERQAMDSGFAQAAAFYLAGVAAETEGFSGAMKGFDPDALRVTLEDGTEVSLSQMRTMGTAAKPVLTNLMVKSSITTNGDHFGKGGLQCSLDVSFTLTVLDSENRGIDLTVSATFVEELKMGVNVSGKTIWKWKWIFPYIADYQFNANLDVYNYTYIKLDAQVTTKEGYTIADISEEMKSILEMTNGDAIKSGVSKLFELYGDMMDAESDWVTVFEQEISKTDLHLLLGIINVRITTSFVVSVDMKVALGMEFEYISGDRYCFWLKIKGKDAGSETIRLIDQKSTFQFYVMGSIGVRAGVSIEIAVGLFSVDLASVGLGAETGAYVRLYGYFFYTTSSLNGVVTSSNKAGALYMEMGVYLDLTFKAQALGGKFQYSPSLFYKEWPILKAGKQKNIYDFMAADGLTDLHLKKYETTFTLPEGYFDLMYLDLKEGGYSATQAGAKDLEILYTNPAVTIEGNEIKVTPHGADYVNATITVRYKNGQLAFTSMPITRSLNVNWSNLDDRNFITFAWGGIPAIAAAPGDAITAPANPTRAGYDFVGWYTDAECANAYTIPATMPDANVTLYAKWTAKEVPYKVEHYQQALKGGNPVLVNTETLTALAGTAVTPTFNSYTGFSAPAAQTVAINGDGSTVLRLIYPRTNYTITLENIGDGGAKIEIDVPFEGEIILPVMAREGHTFNGWDTTPATTMPARNLTYTANWTRNTYNVQYTVEGVKVEDQSKDYIYGSPLYKPTPNAGYEFSGWYTDAACKLRLSQDTTPGRDIQLFGKFFPRTDTNYWVEHYHEDLTGGVYTLFETDTLGGTTDTMVTAASKNYPGFTYSSSLPGTIVSGKVTGDGKLVLKLYYTRNSYTITFAADDIIDSALPAPLTKKFGEALGIEPEATAAEGQGYDFAYWWDTYTNESTIFEFENMPPKNVTLMPKWFPRGDTPYTVEYYLQDAKGEYILNSSKTEFKKGTTATQVSEPRSDFGGEGYITPLQSEETINRRGTTVVEYRYARETYTATYDAMGGTGPSSETLIWGAPLSTDFTRANYNLVGWYADRSMSGDMLNVMPKENVTLYAKWELQDGVELAFDVWVCGVRVTSDNMNNIPISQYGQGTVAYDPGSNMLTLTNCNIKTMNYVMEYAIIYANTPGSTFTIKLVGDNWLYYERTASITRYYGIKVNADELLFSTEGKDGSGALYLYPPNKNTAAGSPCQGIVLLEDTNRIALANNAEVQIYCDQASELNGRTFVIMASDNTGKPGFIDLYDNARLVGVATYNVSNWETTQVNVHSLNAQVVLYGDENFYWTYGTVTRTLNVDLSTVDKYYVLWTEQPSLWDLFVNSDMLGGAMTSPSMTGTDFNGVRIGNKPTFPDRIFTQSLRIGSGISPAAAISGNIFQMAISLNETPRYAMSEGGYGIYGSAITIAGGRVTAAGDKAMSIQPDLTGYTDYIATARTNIDGEDAVTYDPEDFSTYQYICVEPAPSYGIGLSQSGAHTFPDATVGYPAQTPLTVTVSNTGNQGTGDLTVALSGDDTDSFTLSTTSISSISAFGSESFTIVPKTSLGEGTYTATVTVSGANGISASFTVSFTVTAPAPVTVTSVTVKTAPTKITYTAGETLNLSGLVVTLHKSDSTTEDVAFAAFSGKGITASPANGAVLATSITKVTITHTESGMTAEENITVTAAPDPVTVNSVTVKTAPTIVTYTAGETLNLSGLVVTLHKSDNTTEDVAYAAFSGKGITVSPANGAVLATSITKVTITHTESGMTAEENITVTAAPDPVMVNSVTVKTAPTIVTYTAGETLNLSGLVVTLHKSDNTTEDVAYAAFSGKGITVSPANGTVLATSNTKVTITHTESGRTAEENITVKAAPAPVPVTVTSVRVKTAPTKITYTEGEHLNLSGLEVTLHKSDSTTEDVAFAAFSGKGITVSPANRTVLTTSNTKVTITHTESGRTAEENITVTAAPAPVTVDSVTVKTAPTKITYTAGETLNLSGLVVTLHKSDSTTEDVAYAAFSGKGITVSPANGTVLATGNTKVTITHTESGKTAEENITVIAAPSVVSVKGITVKPKSITLYSNTTPNTATVATTVVPLDATDKRISWQSSNTAVATVDAAGKVSAVANGTATITATTIDGSYTDFCTVTVTTYGSDGNGGSGGSSSGNGSSVIVTPPAPDKPKSPTQGEITVPGTVDSKGNVIVSITDKDVTDAFTNALAEAKKNGNEQNGIAVLLRVETDSKTGSNVTVNLPKSVQDTIIAKKIVNIIVVVGNPAIRISLDLATVQQINKQAKADVNITATHSDSGKPNKAIGSRPLFDFKVNYGSGKQVHSFGTGSVSVTIPYTLGKNENAEDVQAVYVDGKGKVHWLANSVYDSVENILSFSTGYFSTYGIGYKQTNTAITESAGHWARKKLSLW